MINKDVQRYVIIPWSTCPHKWINTGINDLNTTRKESSGESDSSRDPSHRLLATTTCQNARNTYLSIDSRMPLRRARRNQSQRLATITLWHGMWSTSMTPSSTVVTGLSPVWSITMSPPSGTYTFDKQWYIYRTKYYTSHFLYHVIMMRNHEWVLPYLQCWRFQRPCQNPLFFWKDQAHAQPFCYLLGKVTHTRIPQG